jgi:mRNA-degrading endonuclease RelE of RelBE toxin-antitoxin system
VRKYFYTPEACENISNFRLTKPTLVLINNGVKRLAQNPKLGYKIPFPLLNARKALYQYQVGGFRLNYFFNDKELSVVSVMV